MSSAIDLTCKVQHLVGTPWVAGTTDCHGIALRALEALGYAVSYECPASKAVKLLSDTRAVGEAFERALACLNWPELDALRVPCLVLLDITEDRCADNHVGVVVSRNTFIHSLKKTGCRIDRLDHPFFCHRIKGYYALPSRADHQR